jgi:hypothetical protein
VTSSAIKQTESELGFELSYQHAQSRGGNEECFRCSRETAMLRDQLKCPQLPGAEFHCYDSINEGRASGPAVIHRDLTIVQFDSLPTRVRFTSTSLATLRMKTLGSFNPHLT